jgi:hypothetical protein
MSSRTERFQRRPRDPSQPQEKKGDDIVKASNPEAPAPAPAPTARRQPPTEEEPEKEEERQLRFPPDEEAVRFPVSILLNAQETSKRHQSSTHS